MFHTFPPNQPIPKTGRVKLGIDPTAPNLHLGHFVPLRLVKSLQKQGHEVDIVLGTFTAQMGDPSGKDKTRPILSREEVEANAQVIKSQLDKVLLPGFNIVENGSWFNQQTLPSFFAMLSKFNLSELVARDAFQLRIEKGDPIGMHELLVPMLQGIDSVVLNSEIEIGGVDQLFNFQITRRIQEIHDKKPELCVMTPIIIGTDGRKMSKSLDNCIFLNDAPTDIFGKCMSISDATMDEWIPLLTDLDQALDSPMQRKKEMAKNIVAQVCGDAAAIDALANFEKTVQGKEKPEDIPVIDAADLLIAVSLIRQCSKSEARRLIDSNSVKINDVKQSELCAVSSGQVIQVGKRNFGVIK